MNKYEYVINGGNYPDDAYEFETVWDRNELKSKYNNCFRNYAAEEAAEDYFYNHDGWEDGWPIQLELYIDCKSIGMFTVDYESRPVFSAYESKDN